MKQAVVKSQLFYAYFDFDVFWEALNQQRIKMELSWYVLFRHANFVYDAAHKAQAVYEEKQRISADKLVALCAIAGLSMDTFAKTKRMEEG